MKKGGSLRDLNQILGRWTRFLSSLLNVMSYNLNPDMATEILQQLTMHVLGDESTVGNVVVTLRSMGKS